jgi:hypothetical protein
MLQIEIPLEYSLITFYTKLVTLFLELFSISFQSGGKDNFIVIVVGRKMGQTSVNLFSHAGVRTGSRNCTVKLSLALT